MSTPTTRIVPRGVRIAHTLGVGFGWAPAILLIGGLLIGGLMGSLRAVAALLVTAALLLVASVILRWGVRATARRARAQALTGQNEALTITAMFGPGAPIFYGTLFPGRVDDGDGSSDASTGGWWDGFIGDSGAGPGGAGGSGWDGGGSSGGWGGDSGAGSGGGFGGDGGGGF